jgi:hypothetical protein
MLVYDPADHRRSEEFLLELEHEVLVNLIRAAGDKSSNNIYWPRVRRFNDAIAAMALREICRIGVQFTWTNHQFDPIICTMDRVLVSLAWEAMFPLCSLTTITRIGSDHTPLAGRRRHVGNHGSFSIHGGLGSDGFRS